MVKTQELQNQSAVKEQEMLSEIRARELTARLEEAKLANEHAEVRISELSAERSALALRVDELE